jgi:hypothetical protein
MKPPEKSLLSFIRMRQAPGWITFGAEYIKAKLEKRRVRFGDKN